MDYIQQWNNPQAIFLLIPLAVTQIAYALSRLWQRCRPHVILQTLDSNTPRQPYRPVIVRTVLASLAFLVCITTMLLLLPATFLTFCCILLSSLLLTYALVHYTDHLIHKYGLYHHHVEKNLNDITKVANLGHISIRPKILFASFALLILALMQPQGEEKNTPLRRLPLFTTILFDLSQSMNANDLPPSRLNAAKDELSYLLDASQGNEVGLVFFTDQAVVQTPQTRDIDTIHHFIMLAQTTDIPTQGTDLNVALQTAMRTFDSENDDSYTNHNHHARRILLVTDGEDHSGNLDETCTLLKNKGIHVDIIAVGTENGAEIPDHNGNPLRYQNEIVISKLQTSTLQKIAEHTEGSFTKLMSPTQASHQILTLWDEIRVNMEPLSNNATLYRVQLYHWFLYPAYLLGLLFLLHPILIEVNARFKKMFHKKGAPQP